eukprot:12238450-Ditylum_brightwellii.AAC.1
MGNEPNKTTAPVASQKIFASSFQHIKQVNEDHKVETSSGGNCHKWGSKEEVGEENDEYSTESDCSSKLEESNKEKVESDEKLPSPDPSSPYAVHPIIPSDAALQSKILALKLLLWVLSNVAPSSSFFNSGPQFQYDVHNYLYVSLLKHCTVDNTTL